MNNPHTSLSIRGLELDVTLGWLDNERSKAQTVLLDVDMYFPKPPLACHTDNLKDTICYSTLIQTIRNGIATKHFRLLEHLSQTIYQIIKSYLQDTVKINVSVTKHPAILGLTGGATFCYRDE